MADRALLAGYPWFSQASSVVSIVIMYIDNRQCYNGAIPVPLQNNTLDFIKQQVRGICVVLVGFVNTLRWRQNGHHFADDIFKCMFLNENVWILIKISLKFIPKGPINNIPALVQIMAWRRSGDKPLSEPMMVRLLTHICVARPQWINPCHVELISRNIWKKNHVIYHFSNDKKSYMHIYIKKNSLHISKIPHLDCPSNLSKCYNANSSLWHVNHFLGLRESIITSVCVAN